MSNLIFAASIDLFQKQARDFTMDFPPIQPLRIGDFEGTLVYANDEFTAEPISFVSIGFENKIVLKNKEPFGHWILAGDTISTTKWNYHGREYTELEVSGDDTKRLRAVTYKHVAGTPVWQSTHSSKAAGYSTFLILPSFVAGASCQSTSYDPQASVVISADYNFPPKTFELTTDNHIIVNGKGPHGWWTSWPPGNQGVDFFWHHTGQDTGKWRKHCCRKVALMGSTEVFKSNLSGIESGYTCLFVIPRIYPRDPQHSWTKLRAPLAELSHVSPPDAGLHTVF